MATTARDGLFARQLRRAAAQRGRLDPVYQQLSDHWTLILQRLYPVWALIGPGLADPAHIELHSRTIYLDSDALLGTRADLLDGALERRRVLGCLGAALHEVMHAKHTKRWVADHDHALGHSDDPAERQLAADRMLLEEPRMEAHGCRDFPPDSARGRLVRAALTAAVADVILPVFAAQTAQSALAGRPLTRDMCGRAMTYLHARTHYGVVESAALAALTAIWEHVLGPADLRALDSLYARVTWIPDGELAPLSEAAKRYREIIGEPDEADGATESGRPGEEADLDRSGDSVDEHRPDRAHRARAAEDAAGGPDSGYPADGQGHPTAGSLADALEQALAATGASVLVQLDENVRLAEVVARAAHPPSPPPRGRARGTGAPTGRIPDRGVDRPPFPDERLQARRYAQRLAQASARAGARPTSARPAGASTAAPTPAAKPSAPPAAPCRRTRGG
jgi:hypothetical protein